jgi:hypothetical protein
VRNLAEGVLLRFGEVAFAAFLMNVDEVGAGGHTVRNRYEVEYSAEPISRSMTAANQIMCVHSTML